MSNIPDPIAPIDQSCFAFLTIYERLPEILVKVLGYFRRAYRDFLVSHHGNLSDSDKAEAEEEAKSILASFSKLRYEMMTDKPLAYLTDNSSDVTIWNKCFDSWTAKLATCPTYYSVSWLYAECYMYRRIHESFVKSKYFTSFDPFYEQKRNALKQSMSATITLGEYVTQLKTSPDLLKDETIKMIEVSLWGNKCDLSLTAGKDCSQTSSPLDDLLKLRSNILINDSDKLWQIIQSLSSSSNKPILDIVLDNSGFELFTDLCMVEFLHSSGLLPADKCSVRWYVKTIPWFVSDALKYDFEWTIDYLIQCSQSPSLQSLGKKWKQYLSSGTWSIVEDSFWTLPYDFSSMSNVSPNLYSQLAQADLLIFKGDLNYRKLVGDLAWENTTPFEAALRGFHPTNLCTLRSIKAEVCVGFKDKSQWASLPDNWMRSSDYAVIQLLPK